MSLYLGENLISGVATPIQGARNIGQIIQSTIPLNDAGLHLLDGALIQGNGIYSDFVTYIAGLVGAYPDLFETEANWQTSVTNYGVCGKFVYDSVNNTVRLPKITGFIEGTTDATALGNLVQAGVPNITGSLRFSQKGFPLSDSSLASGALYKISESTNGYFSSQSDSVTRFSTIGFNASNSNSIYGNSSTVQPQSIKVLYYIVVANSTKTDIEVDIDEIVTDLNGKADTDLSNCTKPHIVETYNNGTSWYRVYSDGWCEQGSFYRTDVMNTNINVTLLKAYKNTNYTILTTLRNNNTTGAGFAVVDNTGGITTTSFYVKLKHKFQEACSPLGFFWETKGYIGA